MIEKLVQYTHLDKLYAHLPGITEAQPTIFGIDADRYAELRRRFDTAARGAAEDLLATDGFAARVDSLPFRAGQMVLAVGDSITDDLQSWAEILRHLLDLGRPRDDVRLINVGLTAHTTAMTLARWPAILARRPDWVLCLLGGNDVTRVGPEATKPLVSLHESVANLRALRRMPDSHLSWVWITPAPVHPDRVGEFAPFRFTQTTWRNDDIHALTTAIHNLDDPGLDDPVIDLSATFGIPADPDLQGPDGVHPSLAGQAAIARAVVQHLTDTPTGMDRS